MNRNQQIFNLILASAAGGKKSPGSMTGAKDIFNVINKYIYSDGSASIS
jgi:hypothetical protein